MTPSELFLQFNESTWVKAPLKKITLTGIYIPGDYVTRDNKYIDKLEDESTGHQLNIIMPENIRSTIDPCEVIEVQGYLDRFKISSDCSIRLQLEVTGSTTVARYSNLAAAEQKKRAIRASKQPDQYKRVTDILDNAIYSEHIPTIVIILAQSSITDSDFDEGIGNASKYYYIKVLRAPFSQPAEVVKALDQALTYSPDAVCLVRGGGADIDQMDNSIILEKAASYPKPLVTALGHTRDQLFLNEIADSSFGTPSLLGTYLRDTANKAAERKHKENRLFTQTVDQRDTINKLEQKLKKLTYICIGLAASAGILLYLLLRT